MPLLEVQELSGGYTKKNVLHDITFHVDHKEKARRLNISSVYLSRKKDR